MAKCKIVKSDVIDDWYTIELCDHPGVSGIVMETPESGFFYDSARISDACVEGTSHEMKVICLAIETRTSAYFKRCAAVLEDDEYHLFSPRNSKEHGPLTLEEADLLAADIRSKLMKTPWRGYTRKAIPLDMETLADMKVVEGLAEVFGRLSDTHLENLVWHAENETPVVCGPVSDVMYTNASGFGWPAVLSTTREVCFNKNVSCIEDLELANVEVRHVIDLLWCQNDNAIRFLTQAEEHHVYEAIELAAERRAEEKEDDDQA